MSNSSKIPSYIAGQDLGKGGISFRYSNERYCNEWTTSRGMWARLRNQEEVSCHTKSNKNEKPFLYEKRPKRKQMGEKSDGYRIEII